jgi:hypothetical protein
VIHGYKNSSNEVLPPQGGAFPFIGTASAGFIRLIDRSGPFPSAALFCFHAAFFVFAFD